MGQRSISTIDRDHRRAQEHRAYLVISELSTVDWESVDELELEDYKEQLEELESECENEQLSERIRSLLDLLDSLD